MRTKRSRRGVGEGLGLPCAGAGRDCFGAAVFRRGRAFSRFSRRTGAARQRRAGTRRDSGRRATQWPRKEHRANHAAQHTRAWSGGPGLSAPGLGAGSCAHSGVAGHGSLREADRLSHEDAEERASLAFKQVTAASLAEIAGENRMRVRCIRWCRGRCAFRRNRRSERTQALRTAAVEALGCEIARAADGPEAAPDRLSSTWRTRGRWSRFRPPCGGRPLSWIGARYDFERGVYASAAHAYERELEFRRRAPGPEHPIRSAR